MKHQSTILLDGNKLKQKKVLEFQNRIKKLNQKNVFPHLVVIQVGNDPASSIYIALKQKFCEEIGIKSTKLSLPKDIDARDFLTIVKQYNNDPSVTGLLIQFPLPEHLSHLNIEMLVDPSKDVDGLHPINQGIHYTRQELYAPLPCTANGIMAMLKEYNIPIKGKHAVVIGRSNIVGKPTSYLLSNANATVSLLHKQTDRKVFNHLLKVADIIVSATGSADLFTPDMIKDGVVIIDVGIIRDANNKIRGDIQYKDFLGKASYITPVPGGVGPMTITMLIENTIRLAEENHQ